MLQSFYSTDLDRSGGYAVRTRTVRPFTTVYRNFPGRRIPAARRNSDALLRQNRAGFGLLAILIGKGVRLLDYITAKAGTSSTPRTPATPPTTPSK